ncbi:Uncharacterised protein [Burkholderia pseudomallei]|nr:Uncharacterised protein [Burkholderia pseudomallei]CAJ3676110.1 Uncharacterised protein [Burkholderia pseudomallei]CAJ4072646.1 Uncharacterised protein [Burkholderia pseudomallei]CAJ5556278.1 Uncharacterised protein [Burkholderia pseudomallei]CAJ5978640.1 Uncharacterised protein [Burkholderia pseudomallei]
MADLIVQHRFCSDAAFGFAARPRRACGLLMRGRLAETATRRSVALSLCRHHAASRCGLRSGQRDRSRRFASNRARRTAFRRPCSTCSTSSLPRKQVALLRLFGLAPGQTRSVFYSRPHERRSATALRARNRPRGDDGHGLGRPRQKVVANRPEALPRRPAPIARTSALAAAAPMAARSRPRGCVTCKAPSAERRSPSETSCASARTGRRAPFGRFSAFAAHRQAGRRH